MAADELMCETAVCVIKAEAESPVIHRFPAKMFVKS